MIGVQVPYVNDVINGSKTVASAIRYREKLLQKITVIHQPDFIPYLGFFHRFMNANLWVILDCVQYLPRGWHARDKIKNIQGSEQWMKISTVKAPQCIEIHDVILATTSWKKEHLNLLYHNYHKCPYYDEVIPYIERLYSFECEKLIDFNLFSIDILCELLNIQIPRVLASKLEPQGKSSELLLDILRKVNATKYLSGVGAKSYMDEALYEKSGIELEYQKYTAPIYPQLHGDFIPYLSSIDVLFNCGIEKSREILRSI